MAIFRRRGGRRTEASRVADHDPGRPLSELRDTGLLWLINRTCFHPRGFALALHVHDGAVTGWSLDGDGSEPWAFVNDIDDKGFARAEATLKETRA